MPTLADDRISLLVGGQAHDAWERYQVDSDLLTPADGWSMRLMMDAGRVPAAIVSGAAAEIRLGRDRIMVGRLDRVKSRVAKGQVSLSIPGRDLAGQLLDCSAPVISAQQLTLDEIVTRIIRPILPDTRVKIFAQNALEVEKVNVEPGDSAWDALQHAAEANGLWAWFEPDGTLVVGGPDYTAPPVATLVLRLDGRGNNVLDFDLDDAVADSYSEITVLAQTHGGGEHREAQHGVKATWKDPSVPFYRPKIVVDHEADTVKHAEERARKLAMDARLKRWTLTGVVRGHRINAPGEPGHGRPWKPGMRVRVINEPHRLDCICFLIATAMSGGKSEAPQTVLTLKEDGVWIVAAHPHKRRHRRGKNGTPARVWDVANSPTEEE
ncbi:phage baseplate assembly protein [Azonexus sp. R2A61]|uniref:phage baseplate assembly protein n=1 Tax=Azonexus sp. R2A61 TaxID=2744443 RepID=UPI001F2087D8|nr:hypothetical protein [Azonexus sp. R2A61]